MPPLRAGLGCWLRGELMRPAVTAPQIAAKELREKKVPFIIRRYLPVRAEGLRQHPPSTVSLKRTHGMSHAACRVRRMGSTRTGR